MKQIYCHSGGSLFQESEGHFMLLTSALGENSASSVIEMLLMAKKASEQVPRLFALIISVIPFFAGLIGNLLKAHGYTFKG